MTTKVLIVNHGPDDVLVSVVSTRAGDVPLTSGIPGNGEIVRPTESSTAYVHGGAALLIEEAKR